MLIHAMRGRRWRWYAFLGVLIICLVVPVGLSVALYQTFLGSGSIQWSAGSADEYLGRATLEEMIADADVIARVELLSVSSDVEHELGGDGGYDPVLRYRFKALEYLKGKGGSELRAMAHYGSNMPTKGPASSLAKDFMADRDTQWDDREAIIFLWDRGDEWPAADYWLGLLEVWSSADDSKGYVAVEEFTISDAYPRWLPAAEPPSSALQDGKADNSSAGGEKRFLLDDPARFTPVDSAQNAATQGGAGGFSVAPTITLADIKARIAKIEGEIAAGGGSEEYRECIRHKYRNERVANHYKESKGGKYFHILHSETISSGLPAETLAYTSDYKQEALRLYGETEPSENWGKFVIIGRDKDLFNPRWPGVAKATRPLPAGEYNFYYAYVWRDFVICDAESEIELMRTEVFVTVTPPP